MITKVKPYNTYEDIMPYHDDLLLWKDENIYNRRWQTRCDNCLSLCCILEPGGYMYKYWEKSTTHEFDEAKQFWCVDFPIIWGSKLDFDYRLEPDNLAKVRVCPLAINGKCFIYEDRPRMCKIYKCIFAQSKYLGVK